MSAPTSGGLKFLEAELPTLPISNRSPFEVDTQGRVMIDAVPALIAYVGWDERYRQANAAYRRWFGIRPEDLIGRSVSELFGESLYQNLKPRIARVLAGQMVTFEEKYPSETDAGLTLQVTYTPDLDASGAVQGFTVLGSDVTARRRAEEALQLSDERWRSLFESMAEGFFVGEMLNEGGTAPDFRFVEVNPRFEKLTGLTNAAGRRATDVLPDMPAGVIATFAAVVATGEAAQFEVKVPALQNRWYEASARKAGAGRFSVLFSDITERKKTQEELRLNAIRMSALERLGDQLRDPRDVPSITRAAMQVLGEALGIARAGYGVVGQSGESITIENDWTSKSVGSIAGKYCFRDFGEDLGERLQRGEVVVIHDTASDPMTEQKEGRWKALEIRAVVNVPIVEQGALSAVLFLHDSAPREWTEADLAFIRKMADRTWSAVERARVLVDLEESEEFARSVLASSPDCVKVMDLDGKLLSINHNGCEHLEMEEESQCLQQPWPAFWPDGDRDKARDAVEKARTGQTIRFEGFCPTMAGTPKWWEVAVAPVRNAAGEPTRLLTISRDITERRHMEQERERLTRELERSNEELSEFAHTVAHDLQSPLRGVNALAQVLQRDSEGTLPERQREFLTHIVASAGRMQNLVEGLLRFAQVGQGDVDGTAVSMDEVVDTALQSLYVQIDEQGATISRDALPRVKGDEVQLVQVLQNLIGNALKYRRPTEKLTVNVSATDGGGELVFAVQDNGEGISPQYMQQIFEPLKRLHGADVPGTGLGLAVCRKIITRHGGRIWATSTPDVGSTFFFTLESA